MKKWEYQVVEEPTVSTDLEKDTLDKLGAEGWELVSVTTLPPVADPELAATLGRFVMYYLKREVQG